jgi:hypothetical protein
MRRRVLVFLILGVCLVKWLVMLRGGITGFLV